MANHAAYEGNVGPVGIKNLCAANGSPHQAACDMDVCLAPVLDLSRFIRYISAPIWLHRMRSRTRDDLREIVRGVGGGRATRFVTAPVGPGRRAARTCPPLILLPFGRCGAQRRLWL